MRNLLTVFLVLMCALQIKASESIQKVYSLTVEQYKKAALAYKKEGPQAFISHYSKFKNLDKSTLQKTLGALPELPQVTLGSQGMMVDSNGFKVLVSLVNPVDATFTFNDEKLSLDNFETLDELQTELSKLFAQEESPLSFLIWLLPNAHAVGTGAKVGIGVAIAAVVATAAVLFLGKRSKNQNSSPTSGSERHAALGNSYEDFVPNQNVSINLENADPGCERTKPTVENQKKALQDLFCKDDRMFALLNKGCQNHVIRHDNNKVSVKSGYSAILGANMTAFFKSLNAKDFNQYQYRHAISEVACAFGEVYYDHQHPNYQYVENLFLCSGNSFAFKFKSNKGSQTLHCAAKTVEECKGSALIYDNKPLCT